MGSNTIRLEIYRLEDNTIQSVLHKKDMAGLASYVDGKGNLTEKGIAKAVSVLREFNAILAGIRVSEKYAFATASLRNVGNTEEALAAIRAQTGLDLRVLSGEQEAVCGYIGATHYLPVTEGVMVDIGGGSTELVFYRDGRIQEALSMPVGSLNMYTKYVQALIPNQNEMMTIAGAVRAELDKIDKSAAAYEIICGVGGTIRAACKLNNEIFGIPASNRVMETEHIGEIIETIRGGDKESLHHILKAVPERIHTVIPGMTVLQAVADYFHCKTIHVSQYGVREGYLFQQLLSSGILHE